MRGPVLKTRSGILSLRWENLRIEDADKAGREGGYFRINDSRHSILGPRKIELDIFLVSKRDNQGGTNHVVLTRAVEHMRYATECWQGKDPICAAWRSYGSQDPAHVPEFLDDTTVGIPWELVVMFRLTDEKGALGPFEIRTQLQHEPKDQKLTFLRRTLSLPQTCVVVLDDDLSKAYPEIPRWSLTPPDSWSVLWYGRSIQFRKDPERAVGRESNWLLESEDDGPKAQPAVGRATVTKTCDLRE